MTPVPMGSGAWDNEARTYRGLWGEGSHAAFGSSVQSHHLCWWPQGPRSRGRNALKPQRDNRNPPLGAQHCSEAGGGRGEKQPHIFPHSFGFKL